MSSIGQITLVLFATVQLRWAAISSGGFWQLFLKSCLQQFLALSLYGKVLAPMTGNFLVILKFNCTRYGPTNMASAFQLLNLFGIFWGIFFVEAFGQVSVVTFKKTRTFAITNPACTCGCLCWMVLDF